MQRKFEFLKSNEVDVKGAKVHLEKVLLEDEENYEVDFYINNELQVEDFTSNDDFMKITGVTGEENKPISIDEQISDWGNFMSIITDKCKICGKLSVCPPLRDYEIVDFPKHAREPICGACKERLYDGGYFKNGVNWDKIQIE